MSKEGCDAFGPSMKELLLGPYTVMLTSGEVQCEGCGGRGDDADGDICRQCDEDGKVRCAKCGGSGCLD